MQLFLQWTALYERCFFCPWQHTRHLQVSFISRVYVRASPPQLFPQHTTARGIGQPAGNSVESQANTGPVWQTYHLCVCMGTSGPPRLWGPLRLPVWQWAYTHSVGVYWCCHGSTVFTPTQVLVYYTNNQQSLQYQSKQAKCHNQTQDYFMNIKLNHWAALIQNLNTARYWS